MSRRKHSMYGFGTISDFRHPLGVLECIPHGEEGGTTVYIVEFCLVLSRFDNTIHCVTYKQQKFTFHSLGSWKFKIKVPADSLSGKGLLPGS